MSRWRDTLLLLLTVLFWGTTFHAARYAMQSFTPVALAAARFLIGALFLLIVTGRLTDLTLLRNRDFLWRIVLLGAVGVGIYNLLFYEGIARVNPARAALIAAANPGITALLLRVWKKEALPVASLAGIVLAFAGVAFVVFEPGSGWSIGVGELCIMGAATAWSIYSIAGRDVMRSYEQRAVTLYSVVAGSLMLPLFVGDVHDTHFAIGPFIAVLYMAIFATGLAYVWWARAVQSLGPAPAAVFMNLVPVTALVIEVLLGGSIETRQLFGGALVIAGVWLTNRR
ncbi:MAG: EamA family transporter [Leptonema illini]|uniref:EamA family transporter n=1 Tax=Leptonema illini TaxID=183 RepID=A0A833H0P8_9LEPT|nr:MAG: EamA family transporter [Leptonema illini]